MYWQIPQERIWQMEVAGDEADFLFVGSLTKQDWGLVKIYFFSSAYGIIASNLY